MFYYIEGTVSALEPGLAVLDCGGVGYGLNITANTLTRLRAGERARLYVCEQIREDCFDLFGFATREEKRSFELLIGVSGVGPKAAQAILSANTPDALALAVMSGNEKALMGAPGVGRKIAQRVIMELKDKLGKGADGFMAAPEPGGSDLSAAKGKLSDAAAALAVLGYGSNEIAAALKGADADAAQVQDLVRQALKKLAGRGGDR